MEVPADILELIKCDSCHDYLSCSPVYTKNNGFTLCGRCYVSEEKQQESVNRNLKYEAVARLLTFPCKYKDYGCNKTVPFAENYLEKHHEQVCEYKNYPCPVAESCEWLGPRKTILEHCQSSHPSQVMSNPCHLMHDIKQFSAKTYILHCFEVLFLLYTKVCIASGKIYHAVKLLDDPEKVSQFKYTLDIKRDELIFSRPGKVATQICTGTDENSSVVTNIGMLLEFLNGFSGTIFTIRIQQDPTAIKELTVKEPMQEIIKPSTSSTVSGNDDGCHLCKKHVLTAIKEVKEAVKVLATEKSKEVKPSTSSTDAVDGRPCRNKDRGCTFIDTDVKCRKHEELFCLYGGWCWTCWSPVKITKDTWRDHYLDEHDNFTFEGNTFFKITSTGKTGKTVFVKTNIGYVCCRYFLNNSSFSIYIWSSSLSKRLSRYNCVLELDPSSALDETEEFELDAEYSETWDWHIKVKENEFDEWDTKDFDIALQIGRQ